MCGSHHGAGRVTSAPDSAILRSLYNETRKHLALGKDAHPFLARYSAPVLFVHAPSLVDFITMIVAFKVFGTHSRPPVANAGRSPPVDPATGPMFNGQATRDIDQWQRIDFRSAQLPLRTTAQIKIARW